MLPPFDNQELKKIFLKIKDHHPKSF